MKVLYNFCYGNFSISMFAAIQLIKKLNLSIYIYRYTHTDENGNDIYTRVSEDSNTDGYLYTVKFFDKDFGETITDSDIVGEVAASQIKDNILLQPSKLRFCHELIELIEKYGSKKISGENSKLILMEVPKGSHFLIENYDGCEVIKVLPKNTQVYYAEE